MKSLRIVERVASRVIPLIVGACFFLPTAVAQPLCVGDCNANAEVSVAELVHCVNLGLGTLPAEDCLSCDASGDGDVTVDELLRAVKNALVGCDRAGRFTLGDDHLGYQAAFSAALADIGEISPLDFSERYAPDETEYLPRISWDVTDAAFWAEINDPTPEAYNFSLDEREQAIIQHYGFVVSERMAAESFADIYDRIFNRDLPVFISTDSLLHAWHRTFDAMLAELEEVYLYDAVQQVVNAMTASLEPLAADDHSETIEIAIRDVDVFLTVARSLLAGEKRDSVLGHDSHVSDILAAIASEDLTQIALFGVPRPMDFSQFKPRGHYDDSDVLRQYFRAMMWLGRVDLRIASESGEESSPRELAAAIVLNDLMSRSGQLPLWTEVDAVLQLFVGQVDSMTFLELAGLLPEVGIDSTRDVIDGSTLAVLERRILDLQLGVQQISSRDSSFYPFGPVNAELASSFTFIGQRFIVDGWATSKTTYPEIVWQDNEVLRLIPADLDVAFSVLANDSVVPEILRRIEDPAGERYRDGLNYQHHLAAARDVIDQQHDGYWAGSIYTQWLNTLRALSIPTTDAKYPDTMRTRPWATKTVDTQLASWTQLRHDTILYAKQPVISGGWCYYPEGFVEPRDEFWHRLEQMARMAAGQLAELSYQGRGNPSAMNELKSRQTTFLNDFADTVATLRAIADKQLNGEELTADERWYLENVIELVEGYGSMEYTGWYPGLFYDGGEDSDKWDAIVADVQTSLPRTVPFVHEGNINLQALGDVNLLVIAIESGDDRVVYLGPTLSHYELNRPYSSGRLNDSEWQDMLLAGDVPSHSPQTLEYLVPSVPRVPPVP